MQTAHYLDDDPVFLDDTVFDVAFGQGRVVELMAEGRFRVLFQDGSRYVYGRDGVRKGTRFRRTLYWHDPVLAVPMKDDISWTQARRLMLRLVEELRDMR